MPDQHATQEHMAFDLDWNPQTAAEALALEAARYYRDHPQITCRECGEPDEIGHYFCSECRHG